MNLVADSIHAIRDALAEYELDVFEGGHVELFEDYEMLLRSAQLKFDGEEPLVLHVAFGEGVSEEVLVYMTGLDSGDVQLLVVSASIDRGIVSRNYAKHFVVSGQDDLFDLTLLIAELLAEAKDDAVGRLLK